MERAAETTTEITEQPLSKGIEVATEEELQQVFEKIRNEKGSKTYCYNTIQFWKSNKRFQFSNLNEVISYAPPITFETFRMAMREFSSQ